MAVTDTGIYITGYSESKFSGISLYKVDLLSPATLELTHVTGTEDRSCIFGTLYLSDVAQGSDGNLYLTKNLNHTILKITPSGEVTTYAGVPGEPGN